MKLINAICHALPAAQRCGVRKKKWQGMRKREVVTDGMSFGPKTAKLLSSRRLGAAFWSPEFQNPMHF